jgi:hypothetical protein
MREIKFRAFSNKSGMWSWDRLTTERGGHPLTCLHSHDGWQVMQFTGVKDSNGIEIYEGDILRVDNGDDIRHIKVYFDAGAFAVQDNFDGYDITAVGWAMGTWESGEVVGNIHENPELMADANYRLFSDSRRNVRQPTTSRMRTHAYDQ